MQLKNVMNRLLLSDNEAISSTIDVMFFLLMVSLSAVVLMPVMLSSGHNTAMQDVAAYRFDGQLLQSLLDSRVEDFEYTVMPSAIPGKAAVFPGNLTIYGPAKVLFTKEHTHRTFADLIAEGMLFSLCTEDNVTSHNLHSFSTEHSKATEKLLEQYLSRRIGSRYNYRLEAHWQPVHGCGLSSELIVGDVPPVEAFRQSELISVPCGYDVSLEDILFPADDLKFGLLVNSPQKEQELHYMFEECISRAASSSAASVVDMYYPEEYLRQMSVRQVMVPSLGDCLVGPPSNEENIGKAIATDILANAVNGTKDVDLNSTGNYTMLTVDNVTLVGSQLRQEHKNKIYASLSDTMSEEINNTIREMMRTNDSVTLLELRDRQLNSILTNVRPPATEITLIVW